MIKLVSFLIIIITITLAHASPLQIVTTDFSPYQTQVGNSIQGIATEIVNEVVKMAGETGEIRMYPWPRAYKKALREPNVIIYSIIRNPEREKMFKWIGIIAPYNVYFWKHEDNKKVKLETLDDAKKYISGGVFNDIKADYLVTQGFSKDKNIEYANNDSLNIRKLFLGRIDLLPFDELGLPYKSQEAGYDYKKLKKLIRIEGISHDLYMAASLGTPDTTVKKLIQSLEEFKKTKKYKMIKNKIK